ncbi:hypothetical protein KY290_038348 [Solanum tuberosum]|uniref:Aminotransferase-like plant mobile domain-containing protein n=1 Tax=Solanum tuberosum TaxID=4113 RepID=A0ABQ7TZP5_SOLTU|nr:hypothetical protein KY289_036213 [Solanum tuberosum]KAH0639458.1 hypothetical protein KY285_036044 [Solanum tuberosum]KAH0739643.1 hypothetical protein KY290_038348 [Solanum tuberosum]
MRLIWRLFLHDGFEIPVLASIYRGLKDISTSSNLGASDILLPIHYVHGWIGLRSSFVTLRLDDELIVEPYSPHRFSRQFGFCQDVPGALIEQHYNGSLLALVQLWDSCVRLGSSLKIIIPMRPSNKGGPKKDDASLPTKGEQLQEKLPHSLKSKVTPNIPPQSVKVVSKSKNSKVKATHVDNRVKSPLQTPKVANITDNEMIDITLKRKKPSSSLDKSVEKSLGIAPSCTNTSKTSISLYEIGISTSASSSSNKSNVSQELHWKRLKKKPKWCCGFYNALDRIGISVGSWGHP